MSAPFFAAESDRWPRVLARLRSLGALEDDEVRTDLRYLENEARVWLATGGKRGTAFPGRRALESRWGWPERRVRAILAADDWHDEHSPVSRADLYGKRPGVPVAAPQTSPWASPCASPSHNGQTPEVGKDCPASVPVAAPQTSPWASPTRAGVSLNHDQPPNHEHLAPEASAPADAGPECVSPESNPTPTMETTDGRDDREPAGEPEAGPVREGGDGGRGGDERRDDPASGAGEASGGGGDEVQGGSRGTDGADLTALWAWISDERKRATPGAGALTLTPKMRTALRSRVAEHGDEAVRRAWTWVLYSAHPRAVFLRAGSYAHPKTFLRPDNCAEYVDLSRLSEAIGEKAAPPSPTQRTASAAWDRYIAPLLADRRYHSQAPPPAYHADPAKHEVIRRAMYAAGGWGHLSKVRDRAEDVAAFRQTFTATLARELECAA